MLQAVVSLSKNSERVALTVLVVLVGIVSYGCAVPGAVVGGLVAPGAMAAASGDTKLTAYQYLDQTQAFRLDEGVSVEQFHQEMWDYVPAQYSQVLQMRISDYVKAFSRGMKKKGASKKWKMHLKEFPEVKSQYEAIKAKQFKYRDHETFWNLKSMAYRAVRLRDGASEEVIIEELSQLDLFFNRRYELYQEKLSKENEGS